MRDKSDKVHIDVVSGIEGLCIYVNDLRVAGPKPWGGGKVIHSFTADRKDVEKALDPKKRGS